MMMVTVTLKKPVEHDGGKLTELHFNREAEVGDMILASRFSTNEEKTAVMLAALSDTPLPLFKKIKLPDFNRILDQTKHLLSDLEGNE
ncbi:hypothetical protein ASD54_04675 [Rhizobium sp. Root149]|nr:hypothetical protein ASD54_04675 [Rhizobium sp. Root149]